jgi:hypothetical protein
MSDPTPTKAALLQGRIRIPEHVVFREFDADTVLLNLRTGQYHGLNQTAGRMLAVLQESGSVRATSESVAAEFEHRAEDVLRDLVELCGSLHARGLIEIDEPVTD